MDEKHLIFQEEIERLKEENERIRQTHVTHEAVEAVIAKTKKDTAKEILQLIIKRLGFRKRYYSPFLIELSEIELCDIAKKYGIELNEKE